MVRMYECAGVLHGDRSREESERNDGEHDLDERLHHRTSRGLCTFYVFMNTIFFTAADLPVARMMDISFPIALGGTHTQTT